MSLVLKKSFSNMDKYNRLEVTYRLNVYGL